MNAQENGQVAGQPGRKGLPHQLWWLLLAGMVGVIIYCLRATDVFPTASIDLAMPRARVTALSVDWANKLGYAEPQAIRSTVFNFDESAKTFLEYELGLKRANALMREKIPVWYWTTRLCRPLHLEEFAVSLTPDGKLLSFDHSLENDRALPTIRHEAARRIAVAFVEEQAGINLSGYKVVEDGSVSQSRRTDHYFSWEDTTEAFKGARMRIYTYVAGNRISSFNRFLYIPETWLRKFSELRSYNKALEEVASIFFVTFNAAAYFAFVWVFTSGLFRWRFAAAVSLFVGFLELAESLNSMPSALNAYTTTMSYKGYVLDQYVSAAQGALWQMLSTLVLVGAAEGVYRMAHPTKVALEKLFTGAGLRSKQVLAGLVAGHGMFGVHLGWVVVYYLFGRELGVWSPLEVRNTEGLSTSQPFFSAMYVGATAALFEELTYRVLGLYIFQKLVRNPLLANLLQAAAWAFMHSNYPQEPPYARGIELTAVGFFYGIVLQRYGLISCITSHYVLDALLGVAPLLTSSLPTLQLTGVIAVSPFILALAAGLLLVRSKGFLAEEDKIHNAAIPRSRGSPELEEIFPPTPYNYQPLSQRVRKLLACIVLVASAIQFAYFFPLIGQETTVTISRSQAITVARAYLIDHNLKVEGRTDCAWLTRAIDTQAMQYIFEKKGFAKAIELAEEPSHPLVWQVRFFRPLDPMEFLVTLDGHGRVLSAGMVDAEDAPGGKPDRETVKAKIESYLKREHPEMVPFVLEDAQEERRKARLDWTFNFDVPRYKVAEAKYKIAVNTVGDIISHYGQHWDLPTSWTYERQRLTTKDQIAGYIVTAIGILITFASIWWIVGVARSGAIRWRPTLIFALAAMPIGIPQFLNDLPEFFVEYSTDTSLSSWFVSQSVRQVLTAVSFVAAAAALAGFGLAAFRLIFPRTSVASILRAGLTFNREDGGRVRREFWVDAVLVGFAAGIGQRAFAVLCSALHARVSPVATLAPLASFCDLTNVFSPALDTLLTSVSRGLSYVLVSAILVGLYAKFFTGFKQYAVFAVILSLLYPVSNRYWQDYLLDVVVYLVYLGGSWLFVAKLARQNILAYFLCAASGIIAGSMRVLFTHGRELYGQDLAILGLVLVSPLVYMLMLRYQRRPQPEAVATGEESDDGG